MEPAFQDHDLAEQVNHPQPNTQSESGEVFVGCLSHNVMRRGSHLPFPCAM